MTLPRAPCLPAPLPLQLLAARCGGLPLVRSPTMTVAAYLVICLHYRTIFWFHYWFAHTYGGLVAPHSVAPAKAYGPVVSALFWLFGTSRGQAVFFIALLYGGLTKQIRHLVCALLACLLALLN